MRPSDLLLPFFAFACLAGCASPGLDLAPPAPNRPWIPATGAGGEIIAGAKPLPAGADASYTLPSNTAMRPQAPPPMDNKAYTLADLVELAESGHPQTRIAWNEARNAALAVGIAQSAYLPKVSAGTMAGYTNGHGQSTALGLTAGSQTSNHGTLSALSLQWLLFDFGERTAIVTAAQQAVVIANIGFNAAHQQVIGGVSQAYYIHAAARTRTASAREALDNARAVRAAAEERYKHGVGTVVETAQGAQGEAQAKLALVQSEGAERDAYAGLLAAAGVPPLSTLRIADAPERSLSAMLDESVERVIEEALARRPDVLGAYAAEKASRANIDAAQAEFMPKIFASVTGSYSTGGLGYSAIPPVGPQPPTLNLSASHYGSGVLVGMTVPLYDGGMRSAALAQARNRADSAQLTLDRVREEAARQIVVSHNALRTSLAAYEAARTLRAAAQTTRDATHAAYRAGVGSITDATLAQTQLLQARNAYSDAYHGALAAAASLALATGSLGRVPQ